MHSKIINCCKILLLCLVFVSCSNKKEDEKLFEELNLCLESSNKTIESQIKNHFYKLDTDFKIPFIKDKVAIWKPKAILAAQLSNDLITYINSLKENIKLSNKLDKEDAKTLYNALIKYKKRLLSIDEKIKSEIGNFITLTAEGKDTLELTESSFYNSFNNTLPKLKLAVYNNRIIRIEEMLVRFCTNQYTIETVIYDEFFRAIAYQNSIHFKPKELLQITAGIGAFTNDVNGKVKINGKEIKLNDEGVAEFKETVPSKAGVYHKTVVLQYTKPDGNISSVEKEIRYTVDE